MGNQGGTVGGTGGQLGGAGGSSQGGMSVMTGGTSQAGGSSGDGGGSGASGAMSAGGTGGQGTGGSLAGTSAGGTSDGGRGSAGRGAGGAAAASGAGGMTPPGGTGGGAGKAGGGAGSGGTGGTTPGLGDWTTGYVATMYGDINSGDCTAYSSNFTDHTPISTYTCVLGSGPRKVTLASYSSATASNASYYAALGDLSSLWSANGAASACTCNGSTTATCGGPSCAAEISSTGSCGLCVAVKCDPNSTFKDSSGYSHNSNCNSTSYVVVQNIDACPHNHTTNVGSSSGWCTDKQSQHIDLSCSGLGDISNLGTKVGQAGWLPVDVQVVDCSIGLGKHSL